MDVSRGTTYLAGLPSSILAAASDKPTTSARTSGGSISAVIKKNRQGAQRAETTEPQHGREAANAGSDSMPKNGFISRHANNAQVMICLVVLTLIRLS